MKLTSNNKSIARFEDRAILVQFYHAEELERTTSELYTKSRSKSTQGVYQQVYQELAEAILKDVYPDTPFKVMQGYPVLENLAIYFWSVEHDVDGWLDSRKSHWDPLPVSSQAKAVVNRMVDLCSDGWTTLCNLFRGEVQRTLVLGKVSLTGLMSPFVTISPLPFFDLICEARCDKALDDYFGLLKTPTWESSLQDTTVWYDGKWVIRIGSLDEQNAMKSLLGVPGIVQLGGSFLVTVGEHKGSILLFTPYTGEPVDDIDSDPYVRITLIDFGHAVRAQDCLDPETCPDGEYLPDGDEELAEELKMRYVVEELETECVKEETELTDSRDIQ
ncbi:hypothetical protein C0992_008808 [Termitomyces sp. T32_za158]|nr:hypothetical protein C0992_008808 [Termitomyces sp. T32_za158]